MYIDYYILYLITLKVICSGEIQLQTDTLSWIESLMRVHFLTRASFAAIQSNRFIIFR